MTASQPGPAQPPCSEFLSSSLLPFTPLQPQLYTSPLVHKPTDKPFARISPPQMQSSGLTTSSLNTQNVGRTR